MKQQQLEARCAQLALQIKQENQKLAKMGQNADLTYSLTLMREHIELSAQLDKVSPFEKLIDNLTDLQLRIGVFQKTGEFQTSHLDLPSARTPRH